MADIQMIITIPKNVYDYIQGTGNINMLDTQQVANAIFDGVLLPKHHGRLIDADYLKDVSLAHNFHGNNKNIVPYSDRKGYRLRDREVSEAIINAKTVIKAYESEDKE